MYTYTLDDVVLASLQYPFKVASENLRGEIKNVTPPNWEPPVRIEPLEKRPPIKLEGSGNLESSVLSKRSIGNLKGAAPQLVVPATK